MRSPLSWACELHSKIQYQHVRWSRVLLKNKSTIKRIRFRSVCPDPFSLCVRGILSNLCSFIADYDGLHRDFYCFVHIPFVHTNIWHNNIIVVSIYAKLVTLRDTCFMFEITSAAHVAGTWHVRLVSNLLEQPENPMGTWQWIATINRN